MRKDKNEKNSSAVTTVITAFWADVFEEKALKERRMGAESTTSTSRANIKGLTVLFHFASSSDSLLLPQPNLISCCSCSSVYSLTSLLFPFVLSSDLIHICHRDYTRWTDIRDQLWGGSGGCLLLSTTSVLFDLFFRWPDDSRCFIIFLLGCCSSNRKTNHDLESAQGIVSFHLKITLNTGLVVWNTASKRFLSKEMQ